MRHVKESDIKDCHPHRTCVLFSFPAWFSCIVQFDICTLNTRVTSKSGYNQLHSSELSLVEGKDKISIY